MRDFMLILHFVGLAMGVGVGFANMFLGIASKKMVPEEAVSFRLKTMALAKMGHIGLGLLLVSGFYLMTPFWATLGSTPTLIAKLIGVLVLILLIITFARYERKARQGNAAVYIGKMEKLGPVALLVAIAIVVLAILTFH